MNSEKTRLFLEELIERMRLFQHEIDSGNDAVDNPQHYRRYKIQHWDVVADWGMNYYIGSATKYLARLGAKDTPINELRKAKRYLEKYLELPHWTSRCVPQGIAIDEVMEDWGLHGWVKHAMRKIALNKLAEAIDCIDLEILSYENNGRGSRDDETN